MKETRGTRANPGPGVFGTDELIKYLGCVNYATTERVLNDIRRRLDEAPGVPITMLVTSPGGPSGTGMSFYDTVRTILRPTLTTIGSGDIDSSGLIIFLTGSTRYVTAHTTGLLHKAGRYFDPNTRYTAKDLRTMAAEDDLKDEQYASIVAACSDGRLTTVEVLALMEAETVLQPVDMVRYGLAHAVIDALH